MEGIHERFLVNITSGSKNREFEVVPNIGHYAILENDVAIAEIMIDEEGKAHVSGGALTKNELDQLLHKIDEHINTGLSS